MIEGNFFSKVQDLFTDAIGFGVALFVSLFLVGVSLFYSVGIVAVVVTVCTSIVLFIELLFIAFDTKRKQQSINSLNNPNMECWRIPNLISDSTKTDDNYDVVIKGSKE